MRLAIVCINSKFVHAALAPWCLLAGLEQYGASAQACVLEPTVNQPLDEVMWQILKTKPHMIGFCCYIWNIEMVLKLCGAIKALRPGITLVLGGPEVGCRAHEILAKNPNVDMVIEGAGEYAFAQVVKGEKNIHGVHTRQEASPPIKLPKPPPSPFSQAYFEQLNGRMAYMETSRGCPFHCAFCLSGNQDEVSFFDLSACLNDVLRLSRAGAKTIKLVDRTFNCHKDRAQAIWRFISEQHAQGEFQNVCVHFEVGADLFDDETISLLNTAPKGLFQLEAGVQTFFEPALEESNRQTDMAKLLINLQKLIAPGNIHVHVDLIAGLPHEGFEAFQASFNQAFALRPHKLQLGFLKLLPGSRLRLNAAEYDYRFTPYPPYEVLENDALGYDELRALKRAEAALDAYYNSGRFMFTVDALLKTRKPYALFSQLGEGMAKLKVGLSPQALAEIAFELGGASLRDPLVIDLCCMGESLPGFLRVDDPQLNTLFQRVKPLYLKGRRLARAMVYTPAPRLIVADLEDRDPVTRRPSLRYFAPEDI